MDHLKNRRYSTPRRSCAGGWVVIFLLILVVSPPHSPCQDALSEGAGHAEVARRRAQEADRWNQEGLRLFSEGRFAQAAAAFEKVYELYPDIPDVGYNLGLALQQAGQPEKALAPLLRSLELRPNDSAARRALGVSLLDSNRPREGAQQLERSLETDPKHVDTLYFLALAYYQMNDPDRAEQCLKWMFARNPDSALLHLRTGNAHRINQRYQEALEELQRAVRLDPDLPGLNLELGLTYIGLKDASKARTALEEEVRRHPGSAEAHLTLGELFLVIDHDYPRAIEKFRHAQELGISPERADFDLGDAYWRLGQLETAEQHLKRVIELNPRHRRAHFVLAKVYQRQGRKAEAQEQFSTVESLEREESSSLKTSFREMVDGQASKD